MSILKTRPEAVSAAPSKPRARRRGTSTRARELRAAVAFLAPVVILLLLLRIVPTVKAVEQSLQQGLPGSALAPKFVGFDNFSTLFQSPNFQKSVVQTLIFNGLVNPIQIVLALIIAYLLTRAIPATSLWRTAVFLPTAIPLVGSASVWGTALRPDGPINAAIASLGLPPQQFLGSSGWAIWSMILISSWVGVGYWMIFLIAGIQQIPNHYYEAARLDGAGALRSFWSITLPLVKRSILFVLVADTVANFVLFAPILILTDGGPQGTTNFLMFDVYTNSFILSDPYTGSAELIVLLAIMALTVSIEFILLRERSD